MVLSIGWCLKKAMKRRKKNKQQEKFFVRNGGLLLQRQVSTSVSVASEVAEALSYLHSAATMMEEDRVLDILDSRITVDGVQEEIISFAVLA